jgi:hypothetical protein
MRGGVADIQIDAMDLDLDQPKPGCQRHGKQRLPRRDSAAVLER